MTDITDAVRVAVQGQPYRCQRAVRIQFPTYDCKVWDGIGLKTISGQVYKGIGSVGAISAVSDTSFDGMRGPVADRVELTLSGLETRLADELRDFQHKGSAVSILEAHFDSNYEVISDPYSIFEGQVDTMSLVLGDNLTIKLIADNFLSYMFRGPDGRRRGDSDQQEIFSGDVGFVFQSTLTNSINWGIPNSQQVTKITKPPSYGLF